jgi:hypothetical protein
MFHQLKFKDELIRDADKIVSLYDLYKKDSTPWMETEHYNKGWNYVPFKMFDRTIIDCGIDYLKDNCTIITFSMLQPGTQIYPHNGFNDYSEKIIRYHFCITDTKNSGFITNNEEKIYKKFDGFGFDDVEIHSAYNNDNKERIVLLFDVPKIGSPSDIEIPKDLKSILN